MMSKANIRTIISTYTGVLFFLFSAGIIAAQENAYADDGYRMWLRYDRVQDNDKLNEYRSLLQFVAGHGGSPTMNAVRNEIGQALPGLLGIPVQWVTDVSRSGTLIAGTPVTSPYIASLRLDDELDNLGAEGYLIRQITSDGNSVIIIAANEETGVLYGVFSLLRKLQTNRDLSGISVHSAGQ